jgi:hypothetical protein
MQEYLWSTHLKSPDVNAPLSVIACQGFKNKTVSFCNIFYILQGSTYIQL